MTFEQWLGKVDSLVWQLAGCSIYDLPDQCLRDWFDSHLTPAKAAKRAIQSSR